MGGWIGMLGAGAAGGANGRRRVTRMAFDDGIWTSRSPGLQHASTCMEPVHLWAARGLGGGRSLQRVKHHCRLLRQLKASTWKSWDLRMNIPCPPAHPEMRQSPGHKHFSIWRDYLDTMWCACMRIWLKSAVGFFFPPPQVSGAGVLRCGCSVVLSFPVHQSFC